tara:strand:- start:1867 stop:4605 length:2739 start_codon:yes stop_codon:yes gene_type:complete
MGEEISFNINKVSKIFSQTSDFLRNKKILNSIYLFLLSIIILISSWMRVQNLGLLKDSTTGMYIPTALDPFYFLRIAELVIEQWSLPAFDSMRYIPLKLGFTPEIMPQILVILHKIFNIFGDYSLRFIDVISPVIFFALSLIFFFFLIYNLTNSRITAFLSSFFLSIIPPYLYRTAAGFSDHESLGMMAFFLVMLVYVLGVKYLEKNDKILKILLLGIGTGFLTLFTVLSWGGISNFVYMIIPLSFFVLWVLDTKENKNLNITKYLVFYSSWFLSSILLASVFGYEIANMINRFALSTIGMVNLFVLGFLFSEFLFIKLNERGSAFLKKYEKYRILSSMFTVFFAGVILMTLNGDNFFSLISDLISRIFNPFGDSRIGSTVAENSQNYLVSLISQFGKIFFWIFYLGLIIVGIEISKGIEKNKHKFLFVLVWIAFISGYLFSKISPSSLFNGTNLISQIFHLSSTILFFSYVIWLYVKEKIKIKSELIIIASWLFFMLIASRGGVRLLFVITPFVVFMASFCVVKLFSYWRKSKDDFFKIVLFILFTVSILGIVISGIGIPLDDSSPGFYQISKSQAKQIGPSTNTQWQQAMSWVRENTPEDSIFVHWWDYGYWVQYLGERPTVTDGGHGAGHWDHLIGRYLLTTPNPETALSFMKTQNVSYLLIDPTDLGKYPAYSKIGSDESGVDRYSQIPVMVLDPSQTQETSDGIIRIYQGGVPVDEDIIYKTDGGEIFLPSGNAIAAGIILQSLDNGISTTFNQPQEIFIYNQKQINIPVRYLYYNGNLIDFKGGLNAVIRIIPSVAQSDQQVQIDNLGTAIYLSPKVSKSLFAQLYLLNDVFENYETIKLAHSQDDPFISILNSQGANIKDFVYFQGFRGPIKILEVNYPSNTIIREEFLRTSGEYAEFDNLEFVK